MVPDCNAWEHQTWALDRVAGRWRFDVFHEPHDGTLPFLDTGQRRWLVDSLAVVHPGHPWRAAIARVI